MNPTETPSAAHAEQDYAISLSKANLIGLPIFVILFAVVLVTFIAVWGWHELLRSSISFLRPQIFLPALLLGVVVHEGLHALGWMIFGRQPASAMKFGFSWKTITPYAHCKVPLRATSYRIGTILPGIVLGLLPSLIAIATGNGGLALFGGLFLGAASGDFLCLWIMRKVHPNATVKDHPSRAGCLVLTDSEVESLK